MGASNSSGSDARTNQPQLRSWADVSMSAANAAHISSTSQQSPFFQRTNITSSNILNAFSNFTAATNLSTQNGNQTSRPLPAITKPLKVQSLISLKPSTIKSNSVNDVGNSGHESTNSCKNLDITFHYDAKCDGSVEILVRMENDDIHSAMQPKFFSKIFSGENRSFSAKISLNVDEMKDDNAAQDSEAGCQLVIKVVPERISPEGGEKLAGVENEMSKFADAQLTYVTIEPLTLKASVVKQSILFEGKEYVYKSWYADNIKPTDNFSSEKSQKIGNNRENNEEKKGSIGVREGVVENLGKGQGSGPSGQESLCVVCLSEERNTVINPCLHKCLCNECADMLRKQSATCPLCRTTVREFWIVD